MPAPENPFFAPSDLPYQLPPFERIREEHFLPAYERGMAEQRAEVEAIATNPEPPTVENTLVALERSGRTLARVRAVLENLASSDNTPAVQEIMQQVAPQLAAHRDAILLDRRLFARVDSFYQRRDELDLDPETRWLLERYHSDFVRAGARLDEAAQGRLRELNQELASLTTAFANRLLADTNELAVAVDDVADLAGLPEDKVAAAAEAARARGMDGYLLTLILPTNQPVLAALEDRELRRRIHEASISRGARGNEHDTREIVAKIVALRAERARLLGYPHHAAYQIADRTAGSVEAVQQMLERIVPAAAANARAEAAKLQQLIDRMGAGHRLEPWDWSYYAEKLRREEHELDRVLTQGVFYAAERLYGLRFVERRDLVAHHPQARVFEVFDSDGSGLGLFIADLYTRDVKRGGAWMSTYVSQSTLLGTKPVVVVNMNINRPPDGEPTLLTVDEVETLFHEFGHVLHGLLSDVTYPRFAGTSVPRDFVEYPSQVNEMWVTWPEVLANYARHHRTGEPMPAELVERWEASRMFNEGFAATEQLAATVLDMAWHTLTVEQVPQAVADVQKFEAEVLAAAGAAVPEVPPRYRTTYFAHVFSGEPYSAGYYSYIWSEVLDADTVEWFKENGGLTRENGEWFRRKLLARGNSIDPMQAFREFRGRDPEIGPLLARRGLG